MKARCISHCLNRIAHGAVVTVLLAAHTCMASTSAASSYNPLPGNYTLSPDSNYGSDEFSVFHMTVAEQFGVINSGFAASTDPRLRPMTRLDSSWSFTAPLFVTPVRLGDSVSSAAFWDQPVRLGGVQLGTLQPQLPAIVMPPILLTASDTLWGLAQSPTVNNRLVDHIHALQQFQKPILTAVGEADYSIESGRIRDNFEIRSNDYHQWLTTATYRYGLTADTTIDTQVAQVTGAQSVLGVGVAEDLGDLGLLSARVGSSRDAATYGWVARLGYDLDLNHLSFALRSHLQSARFQVVGDSALIEPLRQRTLASAGVDLGQLGKVSVASATQTYVDDSRRDIVAVSHAVAISGGGILSTAAAFSPGAAGNSALMLSVMYPFEFVASSRRQINGVVDFGLDKTIDAALNQVHSVSQAHFLPAQFYLQ